MVRSVLGVHNRMKGSMKFFDINRNPKPAFTQAIRQKSEPVPEVNCVTVIALSGTQN